MASGPGGTTQFRDKATPKTGGKRESQRARRYVLAHALVVLNRYCDFDPTVHTCERVLEERAFDDEDTPWFVAWGRLVKPDGAAAANDSTHALQYPVTFNAPEYRHALRSFLVRARIAVRRFGFVGVWALKPPMHAHWWHTYMTALPGERPALGLPFGVTEPTDVAFYEEWETAGSPMRTLQAEFVNTSRARHATVAVFVDTHCVLVQTPPELFSSVLRRAGGGGMSDQTIPALAHVMDKTDSAFGTSVPRTPLFETMRDRHLLDETKDYHMDAEAWASQPLILYSAQMPNMRDTSLEEASTAELYANETPMQVRIAQAEQQHLYTLDQAMMRINDMQSAVAGSSMGQRVADPTHVTNVAQSKRVAYGRPTRFDTMETLPEFMRVAHVASASVINNVHDQTERYRADVAAAFGVPLVFIDPGAAGVAGQNASLRPSNALGSAFGNGAGGSSASGIETPSERALTQRVRTEREFAARLFTFAYAMSERALDVPELDAVLESLDAVRDEMHNAKRARKLLERAVNDASTPEDQAAAELLLEKQREQEAAAYPKKAHDHVKLTRRQVRALMEELQAAPHQFGATIVFEQSVTHDAINTLSGLLRLFDRGLLEEKALEPFAQAVFGSALKLRPKAILPGSDPAADGAPPAKKARKD